MENNQRKIIQFSNSRLLEKPSFQDFYHENYQKVLNYTVKKIGHYQNAEDLVGEVFIYCFNHYDDYDPEKSTLSTWLYLIVNSRIKNFYRDSRAFLDLDSLIGVAEDKTDMDRSIYLEQLKVLLEQALGTLPERQRRIVLMRYFEDKSSKDIASELGMTSANVRVQLSRALDTLETKCSSILEGVR